MMKHKKDPELAALEKEMARDKRYCSSTPTKVPVGRVLAHNHILHTTKTGHGERGFRCWTWLEGKVPDHFSPCPCGSMRCPVLF